MFYQWTDPGPTEVNGGCAWVRIARHGTLSGDLWGDRVFQNLGFSLTSNSWCYYQPAVLWFVVLSQETLVTPLVLTAIKFPRAVVSQACRCIRFPYSFLISFLENEQLYLFLWCNCKYYCWCSGVPCHRQIYLQEIYPLLTLFICFLNKRGTLGGWTQFLWVFLLSKAQDPQVILLFARLTVK